MGKHDQESAAVGARRATGAATGRGRGGRFDLLGDFRAS